MKQPLLPKPAGIGSPRRVDLREVLNANRYLIRSDCALSMLPIHLPPWQTVNWWLRRLMARTIHDVALAIDRGIAGRDTDPTAAIIDSQTVKAPVPGAERGYDGARKTVDAGATSPSTPPSAFWSISPPAKISDGAGAQAVLDALHSKWLWIQQFFADSCYDRRHLMDKAVFPDVTLDIVKRTEAAFVVLPRRWAVERTFSWMTRHRRLVRNYEARVDVSDAMIDKAMGVQRQSR